MDEQQAAVDRPKIDLMARLEHMERGLLDQGDPYGAEVAYHARLEVARLTQEVETQKDVNRMLAEEREAWKKRALLEAEQRAQASNERDNLEEHAQRLGVEMQSWHDAFPAHTAAQAREMVEELRAEIADHTSTPAATWQVRCDVLARRLSVYEEALKRIAGAHNCPSCSAEVQDGYDFQQWARAALTDEAQT